MYVVWHPEFAAGAELATHVYDQLTRNSQEPLSRGLGIPVYLRVAESSQGVPPPIAFDDATHTFVLLLVDSKMVLGRDRGWKAYGQELLQREKTANHRILPVKLAANAFNLHPELQAKNFLPLDMPDLAGDQRRQRMMVGVLHDLCRLVKREAAVEFGASTPTIAHPVRIFISHAKRDGEALAQEIKAYIERHLQLDTFFDKNQIYYGEDFAHVLEQNVRESALLVVQTDVYSTREWCQREVLVAKRHGRPVVVLHKVERAETRSFPYLGNVPVLRFTSELKLDQVLELLLLEVLRADWYDDPRVEQLIADPDSLLRR